MEIPHFVYSSVGVLLGCIHFFPNVNNEAMNIHAQALYMTFYTDPQSFLPLVSVKRGKFCRRVTLLEH